MSVRNVNLDALRARAERAVADSRVKLEQAPGFAHPVDVERLVEELTIYQTELEIQNRELEQAQSRLAGSLDRYRNLFQFLPLPGLVVDGRGFIVEANLEARTLFKMRQDPALQHRSAFQLVTLGSRDRFHDLMQRRQAPGHHYAEDLLLALPDHRTLVCDVHAIGFVAAEAEAAHTLLILVDKSTEAALRESEARFRLMADGAPVLIWLSGPDQSCQWVNQPWLAFTGRSLAEEIGQGWLERVHPDDLARIKRSYGEDLIEPRCPVSLEYRLRRHDGVYRWFLDTTLPRLDAQGALLGYIGSCIDITARKEAEALIDQAREDLVRAQQVARLGSWTFDLIGDRLTWSTQTYRMLDYPEDRPVSLAAFLEVVHPEDREALIAQWTGALAGENDYDITHRIVVGGQVQWVRERAEIRRDASGRPVSALGTMQDVTPLKELANDLERERRRLAEIVWGAGVGTWEWNIETGEIRLNAQWAEMLGYTLGELGQTRIDTWYEFLHPDDRELSQTLVQSHFDGVTAAYECEARMRHKQGHWIWVLDRGRVVSRNAEGRPARMAGTHLDITARKQAEAALRVSEERLQLIFDGINDGIWDWNLDSGQVYYSTVWKDQLGYAEDELANHVDTFLALMHPEDSARVRQAIADYLELRSPAYEVEFRMRHKTGGWRWILARGLARRDGDGRPYRMLGSHTDITGRKAVEASLRLAGQVFTSAREGIMITDTSGRIVDVNDAFERITGFSRALVLGHRPNMLRSGHHSREFFSELWRSLRSKGHWYGEVWNRRRDGELFAAQMTIGAVSDEAGKVTHYVALFSDVTAQKEQQRQLERIAHFDALTGLPNRTLFSDRLAQAMAQASRRGGRLALAYIDLDGFKAVNDTYGHKAGDDLLVKIAQRMKDSLRDGDTVARLGGDEFVALLIDLPDVQSSVPLLMRLLEATSRPITTPLATLHVSGSVGVTFYPQESPIVADQLLRQADQAMYQAKLAGKNRYHVFDAELDRNVRGHHESLERVRIALDRREFVLHFQPQVNLRTGEVFGVEALVRWNHPEHGLLPPAAFLSEIENHPMIETLGAWVLESALDQVIAWRAAGLNLRVGVNVSAYELQKPDFLDRLRVLMARHGPAAKGVLELEVLETHALNDMDHVSAVIHQCAELGVQFALDDFGTGYSSLTYLKRLPAQMLKIDQVFVRDMLDDPDDLAILEGVLGLARAFRRRAIAEGVEHAEHGRMLLQLGCELAQGYAIARPMPAEAIPDWLATWRPDPAWQRVHADPETGLPLIYAGVEHRAWVKAVEDYVRGRRLQVPSIDPHQCRFGEWLEDAKNSRLYPMTSILELIEPLHAAVHRCANDILVAQSRGDNAGARDRLVELHALRDQLLAELNRLLD